MRATPIIATLTLAGAILAAGATLAPVSAQNYPVDTNSAAQINALTADQIRPLLEAQGYSDFREIKRDRRGRIEVKALNDQAQPVELYLHPESGEILEWKLRGDEYRQDRNAAQQYGQKMSFEQVQAVVSSLGYGDILEFEYDRDKKGDKLEVKTLDQQGRLIELYLDPVSGEVLKTEIKRR